MHLALRVREIKVRSDLEKQRSASAVVIGIVESICCSRASIRWETRMYYPVLKQLISIDLQLELCQN